ncbi:MAG: hypothetical protein V3574_04980 [Candidatus Moraniibacteriota bacterium]
MEIHLFFAKLSWFLLIIILYWRPLAQITDNKFLLQKLPYRKHLGIICGISAFLHAVIFLSNSGLWREYFSNPNFWLWDNSLFWGSLAALAMFFPLVTSNTFSQKILGRRWKTWQMFSYPTFVFTGIHVALVRGQWLAGLLPILGWVILWIWARKKCLKSLNCTPVDR